MVLLAWVHGIRIASKISKDSIAELKSEEYMIETRGLIDFYERRVNCIEGLVVIWVH